MDGAFSFSLLALLGLVALAYLVRLGRIGRARHSRVDAEGESALVAKGAMEMFYWTIDPIAEAFARAGISANAITWMSLAFGLGAGVALALGHLGLGAFLATISAAGDALDGLVARRTRTAGKGGEILDAAVDRYVDLAFLAGLAVHFRASVGILVLTLAAVAGSFMVSYSSAKAEALHVSPPRGSMRRSERAVLLVLGAGLTPLTPFVGIHGIWEDAPIVVALAALAIFANASAVSRLSVIAQAAPR